jgi:hypothetical protein
MQRDFIYMMLKTTATKKKVSQVAPLFNPFNPIVAKTQHRVLLDFVKPCGIKWVKQVGLASSRQGWGTGL